MLARGTWVDERYEILELLGRGGMADVLRAHDAATGDAVAVKVLRDHDASAFARFRSELAALRALDHPSIVGLRASGTHDTSPYLVLDLVDGPTLAAMLLDGAIDHETALVLGMHLAEGLAHAHALDITHRDVKPSNVLLDTDIRRPLLADFGLARVADSSRVTRTGVCVGTAAYLAPEQLEGHSSPASDVYALGLVLIECLTGTLCYPGPVAEAALARLHRSPVVPAELPTWLQHTLGSMTDREPDQRPPADAVATALGLRSADPIPRPISHTMSSVIDRDPISTPARGSSARHIPRLHPTRVAVAAALLAVTAGAAILAPLARQDLRVDQPRAEAETDPSPSLPSTTTDPRPSATATMRTASNAPPSPTTARTPPEPTTTTPPPAAVPAPDSPKARAGPKDPRVPKATKPPQQPKDRRDRGNDNLVVGFTTQISTTSMHELVAISGGSELGRARPPA